MRSATSGRKGVKISSRKIDASDRVHRGQTGPGTWVTRFSRTWSLPAMPWKETSPMNEREKFVAAMLQAEEPFVELCERFGISRKQG
jgi:hypothetical protein